jgi:hypothetical protein
VRDFFEKFIDFYENKPYFVKLVVFLILNYIFLDKGRGIVNLVKSYGDIIY